MSVRVAKSAGFCFGVSRAVELVEQAAKAGKKVVTLGPIIHNHHVVDKFRALGVEVINTPEQACPGQTVIIRSHGVSRAVYEELQRRGVEIIDATCPVVLQLQKRIKKEYAAPAEQEKQVVIYGKNGHAEVLGLVGQTEGKAIVIESLEEAKKLDFTKDIRLYSQTTKSLDEFNQITEYIRQHIAPGVTFQSSDTICRQVANRMPNIRDFAKQHDLIFFVSGKKSSNGKILFNECKKVNPNSFLVDDPEEIDFSLVEHADTIGICGATSTPKWLMEACRKAIEEKTGGTVNEMTAPDAGNQ